VQPVRAQLAWNDATGAHTLELVGRRTAGSASGCELVVADRAVSRIHFELDPQSDGLWVRDLGSRNGTHVNGMRVVEARIPAGSVLRVGTTDMTVTYVETEVASEGPPTSFGGISASSPTMRAVFAELARHAKSDTPLVLEGEQGTGKKRLARAVHDASRRAGGPFVIVECAALPDESRVAETLEEALASAEGGTLVLDSPDELPLAVQRELVPPLEAKAFRIIVTAHRDLRRLVNQGSFREALYFKVAGATLRVPALRDREGDIGALLEHFLGDRIDLLDDALLAELERMPWPGNVHELRRYAERLRLGTASTNVDIVLRPRSADEEGLREDQATIETPTVQTIMSAGDPPMVEIGRLLPNALEPWFLIGFKEYRERWIELGEREYLRRLMSRTNRSSSTASREAGLERTYLYRLIKKHGV
jgi:DNA-binding NtrC family response regulator